MLNLCGIVAAILKMPELIADIELFLPVAISKWPPQYCTNSTLSDFNAI
jgi:hypothetical protein